MVAGTNETSLGKTAMSTDGYRSKINNTNLLTDPSVCPNSEFPGKVNIDSGFPIDIGTNLRAESTQPPGFDRRWPRECGKKKNNFDQLPDGQNIPGAAQVKTLMPVESIISNSTCIIVRMHVNE